MWAVEQRPKPPGKDRSADRFQVSQGTAAAVPLWPYCCIHAGLAKSLALRIGLG